MKVKAIAAKSATSPLEPIEIERRSLEAQDVLIDIDYCGVCHSDIHTARNEWQNAIYPVVPGHEVVGHVREVGSAVSRFKVGDRVGVGCMVGSCKSCSSCDEGLEQYCQKGFTGTYNSMEEGREKPTYGGYSTHIVVDENFVLNIPMHLDFKGVAPLLCAGITTYSPLKHVGVKKGDRVAVMGLGGLGHMGVKIASAMGAEVTVLSRTPEKEKDAKDLGATHFVLSSDEDAMGRVQGHFDYILDTVSAKHDVSSALGCLKREGTLIMVGASEKPLDLAVFPLIFGRRKIMGSLIGGVKETQEMLDFCGSHNITSEIELIGGDEINQAYERTVNGDVRYRFVIDCKALT